MANIEIYTKATCPFCHRAKALLSSKGVTFKELPIDGDAIKREEMIQRSGRTTVPQIFIDAQHIGGCDDLYALDARGGLEAPNAPHVFQKDWQPEVKLDLDTASTQLADDVYEVVLRVTVTASLGEETAFLCEVQQGGIFSIGGIEGNQMAHCLGAYCPNILFPYARECITSLVSRGTFPQLNLAPVNFDALFMNYLQQQAGEGAEQHQDA